MFYQLFNHIVTADGFILPSFFTYFLCKEIQTYPAEESVMNKFFRGCNLSLQLCYWVHYVLGPFLKFTTSMALSLAVQRQRELIKFFLQVHIPSLKSNWFLGHVSCLRRIEEKHLLLIQNNRLRKKFFAFFKENSKHYII